MRGGENFPVEVRATMTDATFFSHAELLESQHKKEQEPHEFFKSRMGTAQRPQQHQSDCCDISVCVEYSRFFTNDGDREVQYGPCPAFAKSMFNQASQENHHRKYHPTIQFPTPNTIPLMPQQLRFLRQSAPLSSSMSVASRGGRSLTSTSSCGVSSLAMSSSTCMDFDDECSTISLLSMPSLSQAGSEMVGGVSTGERPINSSSSNPKSCLCLLCQSSTTVNLCAINRDIIDSLKHNVPKSASTSSQGLRSLTPCHNDSSGTTSCSSSHTCSPPRQRRGSMSGTASAAGSKKTPPRESDKLPPLPAGELFAHNRRASRVTAQVFAIQPPVPLTLAPPLGDQLVVGQQEIQRRLKEVDEVILANLQYDEKKTRMKNLIQYKKTLKQLALHRMGLEDDEGDGGISGSGINPAFYETDESMGHDDPLSTARTADVLSEGGDSRSNSLMVATWEDEIRATAAAALVGSPHGSSTSSTGKADVPSSPLPNGSHPTSPAHQSTSVPPTRESSSCRVSTASSSSSSKRQKL